MRAYHSGENHWGTDDVVLICRNALLSIYGE